MARTISTPQVEAYIKAHGEGVPTRELTKLVNVEFSTTYTETQIYCIRHRLGVHPATDGRFTKGHQQGMATRFKPGQPSWMKGKTWDEIGFSEEGKKGSAKTWFKPGIQACNHLPVGSIRLRQPNGYLFMKIAEPDKWIPAHRAIWEEAHGPIPKGMHVTFLDGDRTNIALDNLALITEKENRLLNRHSYGRSADKELTKMALLTIRIKEKVKEIENEEEHNSGHE